MSSNEDSSLKEAASVLLKGGTLTNETCPKCHGIMLRYQSKQTCISCGHQIDLAAKEASERAVEKGNPAEPQSISIVGSVIEEKIIRLANELKDEKDVESQRRKAELLETYLRIVRLLKE